VGDALLAAGGLTEDADSERINQAALLKDGQWITVPSLESILEPDPQKNSSVIQVPENLSPGMATLIDINTATLDELDALPEVGPTLAQRIIEYRMAQGAFTRLEDILLVPGIGEGIYNQIKAYITITP
jgi:competence protein ComEA